MKKYRKMTIKELLSELESTRKELAETRFNIRVGKEKDYAQIKTMRKNIARIFVCLEEKKLVNKKTEKGKEKGKKKVEKSKPKKDKKEKIKAKKKTKNKNKLDK
jgi:ribosomal protein L29